MEAYSSYSSSSSSLGFQQEIALRPAQPFHASLHSVRKPMTKPWKKPIAPLPPIPPKVYKVDPINFRDLVQKLTGAPEFMSDTQLPSSAQLQVLPHQHQRLQRVAPPPLRVAAAPLSRTEVSSPFHLASGLMDHSGKSQNQKFSSDSLGINLSPTSCNWFTFPILSPGTLSSLELSTVP